MLNNGKSFSRTYWITKSVPYNFSMELNIMQIFSFTYSSDIYQKSKFEKNPILLLCFSHAVSVESELAKRANGNLETFQQCNIDIFKRSKFWNPPPAMSRMSILSQRVLQQRWIAVDQSMIF